MSAVLRPELTFFPMLEADLDEVLAIEVEVYEFPWTRGNFSDSIRAGYGCWMCRVDGQSIGYCVIMNFAGEAHLLNLSIAAPLQRAGHGGRLLAHALKAARSGGARLMFLEVRPSNSAARELYARSGFTQVGNRRDYYPASQGREDALVLSIDLP